jgi:hypothetical protein
MDSDDEFNQFVWDELIDSSSSDDELYYDATQIIIDDEVNNPGHIGSVEGHEVVQRERLLYHHLLYKDYFSANPTFNAKIFMSGSHLFFIFIYIILIVLVCTIVLLKLLHHDIGFG